MVRFPSKARLGDVSAKVREEGALTSFRASWASRSCLKGGETVIAERAHGFLFLTPAGRQKPVGRLAIFIPVFSPPFPKEKRIEPNEAVFLRPIVAFPPKEARPIECYNSGDSAD